MSQLSQQAGSGYLWIRTQPKPKHVNEYHEWYNTEHGPLRLKLDFFFNGYRYRSSEGSPPVFLTTYDLKRISGLEEPEYERIRQSPSAREQELLDHKLSLLDRRVYSTISSRGLSDGPAPIIMTVAFVIKNEHVQEMHRWYEEEHTSDLMKIPGWIRSRRFQLVEAEDMKEGYTELLAVHDYATVNGLDGPEHAEAKSKPWRNKMLSLVDSRQNQRFDFVHAFDAGDYKKPPERLTNNNLTNGQISINSTGTGATSWQFDGCEDPKAPVVAFSNSLLTDLHIWDHCVKEMSVLYPHLRFLRYNTRGYESGTQDTVDVDVLSADLALLLDDLGIKKCFAVIGVSLGGITTLNFAIRYPERLDRFIAADCNVTSSEKNTKAWNDRIALANSEGGWEKLAQQTVERWFTSASVDANTEGTMAVKQMILSASKPGFESCVRALCDLDLSEKIKNIEVPGMCIVGSQDGVLPGTMAAFSKQIPQCAMTQVEDAGHLPMVEKPSAFVQAILPIFELHKTG